ncbi:unnamed protein product [Ambrosiozyma monospora]|uniref:Unnamed protein product n=1 Tax=Ambrosiozyma monospora TaxID=43982 RepID=A0A9W6YTH4_AMBMO|nr:unnamed protein product [Ambrosiozyma monospora]
MTVNLDYKKWKMSQAENFITWTLHSGVTLPHDRNTFKICRAAHRAQKHMIGKIDARFAKSFTSTRRENWCANDKDESLNSIDVKKQGNRCKQVQFSKQTPRIDYSPTSINFTNITNIYIHTVPETHTMATSKDPSHLYRSHHSIKIGGTHRFIITYIPQNNEGEDQDHEQSLNFLNQSLFVKIKNVEFLPLRAAYIAGPYVLYVDICSEDYHSDKACFITADQPKYDPNLAAGQSICAELSLHTLKEKYVWVVDVQSQILFSTSNDVHYDIMVGLDQEKLHRHNFGDSTGKFSSKLDVQFIPTVDLWNKPPPFRNDNVHLVVLTHGLHSNSTADMFYLKEKIEHMSEKTGDNICVRAYTENVCKTERGVKYLAQLS